MSVAKRVTVVYPEGEQKELYKAAAEFIALKIRQSLWDYGMSEQRQKEYLKELSEYYRHIEL